MDDGDVVVFMNFRADRARELTRALTDPAFDGFARPRVPKLAALRLPDVLRRRFRALPVAFAPQVDREQLRRILSARFGLAQLRIAETEKYAHVTYFFNGGSEAVYPGEDRILVPSPKVATYDLKPEMSAPEVTDRLVEAIDGERYDAIVCNYANGDMVGHTGNFEAATRRVETLDACIGRVVDAARAHGRRSRHHRGSWQRRADARRRHRPGAHGAHAEPRAVRLRRPPGEAWPTAARCRTSRRRCWRSWDCRSRRR